MSLNRNLTRRAVLSALAITAADMAFNRAAAAATGPTATNPTWTAPQTPYRIAGNLHYVGSRELASFLIATPDGHILINSNLAAAPMQIKASVEQLGFQFRDIKILLVSHAHFDHCAGSAEIKRLTGAKYMVMDADVADVESGGTTNFQFGNQKSMLYPPTHVDRVLHDGETVRLGDTVLTARKTPGHTKGCTTWTLPVQDEALQNFIAVKDGHNSGGSKAYQAVIVGSPYVLSSYDLVHAPKYPQMAADFAQTFRVLESLPCDIFLGAHGGYYNMLPKYERFKAGDLAAFVDPAGYREFTADAKQTFESSLAAQQVKPHKG